jgi:diadenosine tetraphosphate (Ap4A) HIT family hydrolase
MADDCPICAKHRGKGPLVGPLVWEDDHVLVTHLPLALEPTAFGYLFVETRRHVRYVDEMTEPEARAVGYAVWRAARALRAELSPSYVHSAIAGRGVPHFHQHVFVRPRGIPAELPWHTTTWPSAPPRTEAEITDLSTRLSRHF